jgi:hypothetical protein
VDCYGGQEQYASAVIYCDYVPSNSATGVFIVSLASVGAVLCAALCLWILYAINSKIIRRSQPYYLITFVVGACIRRDISASANQPADMHGRRMCIESERGTSCGRE